MAGDAASCAARGARAEPGPERPGEWGRRSKPTTMAQPKRGFSCFFFLLSRDFYVDKLRTLREVRGGIEDGAFWDLFRSQGPAELAESLKLFTQ